MHLPATCCSCAPAAPGLSYRSSSTAEQHEAGWARERHGETSFFARERRRGRWQRDGNTAKVRKYARVRPQDAKLEKYANPYAKLLELHFSSFAKKPRMASAFAKLLEILELFHFLLSNWCNKWLSDSTHELKGETVSATTLLLARFISGSHPCGC